MKHSILFLIIFLSGQVFAVESKLREKIIQEYLKTNEAPKQWKEKCRELDGLGKEIGVISKELGDAINYTWFPTSSEQVKKTIELLKSSPHPDEKWNSFILLLSNLNENEIKQLINLHQEMPSFWSGCSVSVAAATGLARGIVQRKVLGEDKKLAIKAFVEYLNRDKYFWYQFNYVTDHLQVIKELSYFHYIAKSKTIDPIIEKSLQEIRQLSSPIEENGGIPNPSPEDFLVFIRNLKVMKKVDVHRSQIIKILNDHYSAN